MATVRRAPYKDFLQPSLQRRFSSTTTILLVIAYVEAVVLALVSSPSAIFSSWWSLFFVLFPIGPTGARAFCLFCCGLTVIILRIAQYHVGIRTTNSGFQTVLKHVASSQTLQAIFAYTLSSLIFSQVYLWCSTAEDLDFILIQSGDRARLNERPIFYTTHFVLFGMMQGILHIYRDDDRLLLGAVRLHDEPAATHNDQSNWQTRLRNELPVLASRAAVQSGIALLINVVLYHVTIPGLIEGFTIRGAAWRTALSFFRTFYTLPKTNMVPATLAALNGWVLLRCLYTGAMLLFLWLAGNRLFSLLLVRAPLKLGQPLTSESTDPNGSLLNGLKSKKLHIKCFALWELALIARDFQARRKSIYHDIDRKDGPMWSQVYKLCLDIVNEIGTRIDFHSKSPEAPVKEPVLPPTKEARSLQVNDDHFLLATPKKRSTIDNIVGMAAAQSPGQESRLSPLVQKGFSGAKGFVGEVVSQATSSEELDSPFQKWPRRFLESPIGAAFRQTYDRRITSVILGTPYGEPSQIINAISALTRLALLSLVEDSYGNVQRDVSSIVRAFTAATVKLGKFKADFPVHWTDLGGSKECSDVDAVLTTLKEALRQLMEGFEPYARDIRLSFADVRLAREAAGFPPRPAGGHAMLPRAEMRQVR